MTTLPRFLRRALTGLLLSGIAASPRAGETWPAHPVRLIVPFPATGPLDLLARSYAQKLGERWGQTAVVENRAGATGTIGAALAAKAVPDGYTLLLTVDLPIVMAPVLVSTTYDPRRDLVPVAAIAESVNMLVVHPSVGAASLAGLVAAARARPGALTYASAGPGSPGHLCGEMLRMDAGIDITHVPYKGAAPAAAAVLAGEVSMFCGPIAQGLASYRAGRLRAVGITGAAPSPLVPELAPLAATYPGLVVSDFYAVFAPSGIPDAILESLRSDLRGVWEDAGLRERLGALGIDALWLDGAGLSRRIEADLAKWSRVVKAAGIKAE